MLRQLPHLLDVGPAEPVLHRASGRRTHRQQVDVHVQAGKLLPGPGLDLGPEALTGLNALGHDDHLAVIGVRRLRVEGEDEPHGALADIGRPVIDVGIACELGLEAVHLRLRVGDRGVLRQGEVDEEFVAVRGRKELLLDEPHAVERDAEHRHRHADGQPAPAHGADEDMREHLSEAARLVVMLLHRLRQQLHAEQGAKSTATIHDSNSEAAITTNSVKVNSPALLVLSPTGMKLATVTSVPVSIGNAVEV